MSARLRLTLTYAGLLIAATTALLAMSWWLLSRHLERTVPDAYADGILGELATQYGLAVVGFALLTLGAGWAVTGRALAPIQSLADAQRRFVANASHELRTPLTVMRAEAEVALDDPDVTPDQLREVARAVVETTEQTEHLLDGLLTLATTDRPAAHVAAVDLANVAATAIATAQPEAAGQGKTIVARLNPTVVRGDAALLERVVGNLLENALRHGDGDVELTVGRGAVTVTNGGRPIAPEAVAVMAEPFERLDRTRAEGSGLGLSIVAAVVGAYGGSLTLTPRPTGGLTAEVRLPTAA